MELYLHLPFCASKCRYCDFASYPHQENLMDSYVDAVIQEAACVSSRLHGRVETVFVGGGTPSILPAELFEKLLSGVLTCFPAETGAEFTSECNPGTVTREWLDAAVRCGVNRISMGMQAYQPQLLRTLGRIHNFSDVRHSVSLVREAGIRNISLDLMFGLPGQTVQDWHQSLDAALSLSPTHISCYGLIPEDGTRQKDDLDAGRLQLPDEDAERRMYDDAIRILADHGFHQYEISNFALPGYECRHNLGYWRQIPYLGLGASASSMLRGTPDCAYIRTTNPPGLKDYLRMVSSGNWSMRSTDTVLPADAMFETLMLGLRTTEGVSEAEFLNMHGIRLADYRGERLADLAERGLLLYENGCWRLSRHGMDVQNSILVELMDD